MILADGGFGLLLLGLWLFCLVDVITTPEGATRNLPKMAWLFIVLLLFDVGSLLWLIAGREWNRGNANLPYKGNRGAAGQPDTGRYRVTPRADALRSDTRPARASNPDDDEEFLIGLRARAEEQRRRAREADGRTDPMDDPTA